jgi:hypothetical protein
MNIDRKRGEETLIYVGCHCCIIVYRLPLSPDDLDFEMYDETPDRVFSRYRDRLDFLTSPFPEA